MKSLKIDVENLENSLELTLKLYRTIHVLFAQLYNSLVELYVHLKKKKKNFSFFRDLKKKKKKLFVFSRSYAKKKKQFELQYKENDNFDSNNNILDALNNLNIKTNIELDIDAKQSFESFVKKSNKTKIVTIATKITREHTKIYYRNEKNLKRQ